MKKLFRSFVVFALIVPFLVGLAACGKNDPPDPNGYTTVNANEIFANFRSAYINYQDDESGKMTMVVTTNSAMFADIMKLDEEDFEPISSTEKTIAGINLEDEEFFRLTFNEDGMLDNAMFIVTYPEENVKRVYAYSFNTEKEEDEENPQKVYMEYSTEGGEESQWKTEFWDRMVGYFENPEMSSDNAYFPEITEETELADFKEMLISTINGDMEDEGYDITDENLTISGKKYNDGRIGLVVSAVVSEDMGEGAAMNSAMSIEYVVKDGKLIGYKVNAGISMSGQDESGNTLTIDLLAMSVEMEFDSSYNTSYLADLLADIDNYKPYEY